MLRIKRNVVFLILFLIFVFKVSLNAQNSVLESHKLNWKPVNKRQVVGDQYVSFLSFDHATYRSELMGIPVFSKMFAVEKGQDVEFSISNANYIPLTLEELEVLTKSNVIVKENIAIEKTILYDRGRPVIYLSFLPFRKNSMTGTVEKIDSFELSVNTIFSTTSKMQTEFNNSIASYASNSVLSSGNWYKIGVTKNGVYKLDRNFFHSIGIDTALVDPRNIRIYGNGGGMLPFSNNVLREDDLVENAIQVIGESDGVFDKNDYVLFYGQSQHKWNFSSTDQQFHHSTNIFSDTTYYFISTDLGVGKRIAVQTSSSQSPSNIVTSFVDYAFHEVDATNFIKSGREWYGEKLDIQNSISIPFSFPNVLTSSVGYLKTSIAARYDLPYVANSFTASCEGFSMDLSPSATSFGNYIADYAYPAVTSFSFTPSGSSVFNVSITKNKADALGWINYVELNLTRELKMSGSQLVFRDIQSIGNGNVSQFILSNASSGINLWEITDPFNIKLQSTNLSGNTLDFVLNTDSLREFIAFDSTGYLTPAKFGRVANQNLHGVLQADMIIVTHPLFMSQANAIANWHRNEDNLSVVVVTPEQIYNEFSSGSQDITAIRSFVRMLYERANGNASTIPKYLLLFGDGSYDYKYRFPNNTNFVPAYQSINSTSYTLSFVSDDFYGLLDPSEGGENSSQDLVGLPDIGIGRFPVKSISEAQTMVDKVVSYTKKAGLPATCNSCADVPETNMGDWRNMLCFIGDDEDGSLHTTQSNSLADGVLAEDSVYNFDKIFLDAYVQQSTPAGNRYPDVVEAINKRLEKGSLILNYTGHGGELGLAHEQVIDIPQINAWSNKNKLPLFFTATCEFSRFDDPDRTSAGEYVILNPKGGAIALMTTVRVVYANPNFTLNQNFYEKAFDTLSDGRIPAMGDLFRLTKVNSGSGINNRNFTLLGDPALALAYPKYDVKTVSVSSDTLKALSTVTVTGYVQNRLGNKLNNYNGILYPTIFDKKTNQTTLSNDGLSGQQASPPVTFGVQKNVLYKGKVSVTNGDFSFSFVVPKDVAGNSFDGKKGKISYYASDGYEDANGYYNNIVVGGTTSNAASDLVGPQINLYMNDTKFVFGGTTNENPKLFAKLNDVNGINTSGVGIGHDIVAVLDGNTSKAIVLNDYYEADLNSYQSGAVRYPFSNLSVGKHTLKIKVWDVYNNSSEAYTEFVVAPSEDLTIKHLLNYPNPFTTNTAFYFEHNQVQEQLDVQIQIFSVSGKLVKNIHQYVKSEGFRSEPIYWDGKDEYGDKIGKGVYVYRLKVRTSENKLAEQYEKLVILN